MAFALLAHQQQAIVLQLHHEDMLLVRGHGGGHKDYNEFRSAFELLEAVGKAPTDAFEDTNLSLERRLKQLEEVLKKLVLKKRARPQKVRGAPEEALGEFAC